MTITQFTFQGAENVEYAAEVSAEQSTGNTVRIVYTISWGNETERFPIDFNTTEGTMNFSNLAVTLPPYVWCLIACGLGHLAKKILDCWKNGQRNPSDLLRCLKGKGHSIASDLGDCALNCLSSIGGGNP